MSDLSDLQAMQEKRRRESLRCAYDTSMGANAYDGLGCFRGKVTREVTIHYNEVETDTFYVCEECYKRLVHCVRRDGYKLTSRPI